MVRSSENGPMELGWLTVTTMESASERFQQTPRTKSWVEGRRSLRLKEAAALTDRQILDACDALTILKVYDGSATLTEAADLFPGSEVRQ